MKTNNKDDLKYYHCSVFHGEERRGWCGWAQSSDDAEGKALSSICESKGWPKDESKAYCEGHE